MRSLPRFRREVIHQGKPGERVACLVGDLNADGQPEIIIAQRAPMTEAYWLGRSACGQWQRHTIDDTFGRAEAGGCLADLTGTGRLDLILGGDYKGDEICWWQCPADPTQPWQRRLICRIPRTQSHDQMLADVDGDGRLELYFWNQGSRTLFCVPVPDDPRVSPWPGLHSVAGGLKEEGLCVADVDGDGKLELIAGLSWYRPLGNGLWERHEFARGYVSPRSVVADFDGDGRVEIAISEGDASLYGRPLGRVVLFKASSDATALWEPHVLHEGLVEPHSIQVADFDGDGRPDLFVGEAGLPKGNDPHPPAQRIFQNQGGGRFVEHIIDEGVGTHEAKVIVLDSKIGIAGKPYRGLNAVNRDGEADCVHLWLPKG